MLSCPAAGPAHLLRMSLCHQRTTGPGPLFPGPREAVSGEAPADPPPGPAPPAPRPGPAQTVSRVPRTDRTASTANPANQARIVMYAVTGTEWLLIRSVPILVIW
jgi:hypothetical protein